jgi:hypothetical protein
MGKKTSTHWSKPSEEMNEVGTIETVKPDSELMALTKSVVDQNDTILRMNMRLIDMLTSPLLVVRDKDTANAESDT